MDKESCCVVSNLLWWSFRTFGVAIRGCITMIAFSFIASSIYCLNDIIDVEDDHRHPKKCNRPLASGRVSIAQGYAIMIVMVILSMVSLLFSSEQVY